MALPFLTDYDPAGGAGGSIDPLGALRTYYALVDLILPEMTTITTRSRYLTMLCAALDNAEDHREFRIGPAGLVARRQAIEPYERLWALACATAKEAGVAGAAADLRGISFAEKALAFFKERQRPATPEFRMLKSQGRTGGVTTYWTLLVSGGLVTPDGVLTPDGKRLAGEFPKPPTSDLASLADPSKARRVALEIGDLEAWGKAVHLAAARSAERRLLADGLRSDARRDRMADTLVRYATETPLPERWGVAEIRKLGGYLARDEQAAKLGMATALDAAVRVEQFHEAALAVFDTLLWWAPTRADESIMDLAADSSFASAVDRAQHCANILVELVRVCDDLRVRDRVQSFAAFASDLARPASRREFLDELLRRHRRVQDGKVDGGSPKSEWVRYTDSGRVLRPSPRYQRPKRPQPAAGRQLTHPYRLEPFVQMLRESDLGG